VVPAEGREPDPSALVEFLVPKVARWWLPERWARVGEIPKTSVGKFDKLALRADYAAGKLEVVRVELPMAAPAS
jgi:fatty-acyl-CoA synthase